MTGRATRGEKNAGERAVYPKCTHTGKKIIQLKHGQKLDTLPRRERTADEQHVKTPHATRHTPSGEGEPERDGATSRRGRGDTEQRGHCGTVRKFLTKLSGLSPCDPVIVLLRSCPKELKTYVHTKSFTWMFTPLYL